MSNNNDKIELSEAISLETIKNTVLYPTNAIRSGRVEPKIRPASAPSENKSVLLTAKPETVEIKANETSNDDKLPFHQAAHEHIQDWFFRIGEEFFGPFSKAEIKQGIITGELSIHTYVSNRIEGPFATLERHPDFNDIFKELEKLKLYKRTG